MSTVSLGRDGGGQIAKASESNFGRISLQPDTINLCLGLLLRQSTTTSIKLPLTSTGTVNKTVTLPHKKWLLGRSSILRILFIHQNAPGQFRHLAPYLASNSANQVVFMGQHCARVAGRIRWVTYSEPHGAGSQTHHYLHRMEASVRRGQQVLRACNNLQKEGFKPDLVVAHPGWGETMFIRDLLPNAKILHYCEMFYRPEGQDTGYIPETAIDFDGRCRLRAWNADLLTALDVMDHGISATEWQRAQHPTPFQSKISVIHDGIDLAEVTPLASARFTLPNGLSFVAGDEVLTYVARHLEPMRGFLALMHAVPKLLQLRPQAHIVICGEDGLGYGRPPPDGGTWREAMLRTIAFDPTRVHFVGRLPRREYLSLLQVSALHLYLTVPFVLSWSCAEALAAGCLVLGSDVAPVREVIQHGENGFLVDLRDAGSIACRAADLLACRERLPAVRARARERSANQFDLRRSLAAQSHLIRQLVA